MFGKYAVKKQVTNAPIMASKALRKLKKRAFAFISSTLNDGTTTLATALKARAEST
jgi:hypothetical protein